MAGLHARQEPPTGRKQRRGLARLGGSNAGGRLMALLLAVACLAAVAPGAAAQGVTAAGVSVDRAGPPLSAAARAQRATQPPSDTVVHLEPPADQQQLGQAARSAWVPLLQPVPRATSASAAAPADAPLECALTVLPRAKAGGICRIFSKFEGRNSRPPVTCTGFKLGNAYLGTAAHCVYSQGYYATSIQVWCVAGGDTCGVNATAWGVKALVTPSWRSGEQPAFDAAVIKTSRRLPGRSFLVGQFDPATYPRLVVNSTAVGFPVPGRDPSCAEFYSQCRQYRNDDAVSVAPVADSTVVNGTLRSVGAAENCLAASGAGVVGLGGFVFALSSVEPLRELRQPAGQDGNSTGGGATESCGHYHVRQVNQNSADSSCEGAAGGVSLLCLMYKLQGIIM